METPFVFYVRIEKKKYDNPSKKFQTFLFKETNNPSVMTTTFETHDIR